MCVSANEKAVSLNVQRYTSLLGQRDDDEVDEPGPRRSAAGCI
jgi:hypothetical protein